MCRSGRARDPFGMDNPRLRVSPLEPEPVLWYNGKNGGRGRDIPTGPRKRGGTMSMKRARTIGFLGFGQMGSAIAAGLARFSPDAAEGRLRMTAWTPHPDRLRERIGDLPVVPCTSPEELADSSDWLLLAVKPYQAESAAAGIRDRLAGKAVISVVNAMGCADLTKIFGPEVRVQYVMPNTPMRAGAGAALGQFGVTAAYRYAEPRSIAVYDYTNVIFTALFGFAFFGQVPDALSVVGFAVILLAAFGMSRKGNS